MHHQVQAFHLAEANFFNMISVVYKTFEEPL